jgi:drug/metabolite transporter (DMT)-like permease
MVKNINSRTFGYFIQFVSVILNCISILISKLLLSQNTLDTFIVYSSLASLMISIFISILFFFKTKRIEHKSLNTIFIVALLNLFGLIFFFKCLQLLHPAAFGLYSRFFIIFGIIFSFAILKEKSRGFQEIILIVVAIIGMFMFTFKDRDSNIYNDICGFALVILHCFFFSLAYSLIKKYSKPRNFVRLITYSNTITFSFLFLIFCLYSNYTGNGKYWNNYTYNKNMDYILIFTSSLLSIVSTLLFFKGTEFISFRDSTMIRSINPIALYLISFPFFPIFLSTINIYGAFICLFSLFSLNMSKVRIKSHFDKTLDQLGAK